MLNNMKSLFVFQELFGIFIPFLEKMEMISLDRTNHVFECARKIEQKSVGE